MFGRKKHYDEYEDDREEVTGGGTFVKPIPAGLRDYAIGTVLLVFVIAVLSVAVKGELNPIAWHDALVAASFRPADSVTPGIWRLIAKSIFGVMGVSGGTLALLFLGKAVLGVIIALAYLVFRDMLAVLIRSTTTNSLWSSVLSRIVSAFGALALFGADPVWKLGYAFTPDSLLALLLALSVFFSIHFIASGTLTPAYWAVFITGLVCAESPLGLILMAFFVFVFWVLMGRGGLSHVTFLKPLLMHSSKWYMTFFWASGLVSGIAFNVLSFIWADGTKATGIGAGDIPLHYVTSLWNQLASAANAGGWIMGVGLAVVPFVIAISMMRRAADIEYFLSYHIGIVYFVIGAIAYTQVATIQELWFWALPYEQIAVNSEMFLFVFSFMFAAVIVCSLSVVAVDVFCRSNRRLAAEMGADEELPQSRPSHFAYRVICGCAALAALMAGLAFGRNQKKTNVLMDIIDDYVKEIACEAEGLDYLFTDGAFDWEIESITHSRGKKVETISLMPGRRSRNIWSLVKLMTDREDKLSAEMGGPNLLRTWQRDRPDRMKKAGVQLGLEVWRDRTGRNYPPVSGVLARMEWPSEEMRLKGIERTHALAKRIEEVYEAGLFSKSLDPVLRESFLCMQWRIARLARVRAEILDIKGNADGAKFEKAIADSLDDKNSALKRMRENLAKVREFTMRQMTPREGLQFALQRADFILARKYAEPVLDSAPDNVEANYAMGMSYWVEEQYTRAEEYLQKCVELLPSNPTINNNLALVRVQLGKYEQALENAKKALEVLPESPAVIDTVKTVEKAMENAQNKAEEAKDGEKGQPAE